MRLNKEQKDIITHIQSNEITDIYSFVRYYKLGMEVCHDKIAIEDEFKKRFCNKNYKCKTLRSGINGDCIVKIIDDELVLASPKLEYLNSNEKIFTYNKNNYKINSYQPIYVCQNINKIISFIALWQYLKKEGLIIELPKTFTEKDLGLFLQQKPKNHVWGDLFVEDNLSLSNMSVNITDLFTWEYELNRDMLDVCFPYLNLKLYPAPELSTYISKRHKTLEEIRERRNMQIAFAGVLIALLTSVASIFISFQDRGYYEELQEINHSIQDIHEDLAERREVN